MASNIETITKKKSTAKSTAKKTAGKTTAKKTTAKKTAVKKTETGKSATKKTAEKKAPGKKTTAKKTTAKKNGTKKTAGKTKKSSKNLKGLIIVESPAKARTIERYTKGKYSVKASMGHVRDLPKTRIGVDTENEYAPRYMTIRKKKAVVDELKSSAKNASKVLLAPDPDREGEAIAWHLAQLLKVENPQRIEMHEITRTALEKALENPRTIDMDRVNAQQARRVLDRLVGYSLSPLLWRKISGGLSAGRVQSVAVKLVVDRQKEIDEFVPQEYWSLSVLASKMKQAKKDGFSASLVKKLGKKIDIPDKEATDEILDYLRKNSFLVGDIRKKPQKKTPPPPYKTSTLQQDAYRKLGFSAKKTMTVAQQLYEGINVGADGIVGLITYMRTDSARISPVARQEAEEFITGKYGKEYLSGGRVYKSSKSAQEAHEAIRPTSCMRIPDVMKNYLKRDQLRLYSLIWNRFLASQMAPSQYENTTVDINCGDYLFRATDSILTFPGYLKIYEGMKSRKKTDDESEAEDEELSKNPLPPLKVGEILKVHQYLPKQHFTQPPPYFTEASLIKTLEEKGIGRPSTYAPIVDTIQKRGYVEKSEKKFIPTNLGRTVTEMLEEYFPNILDVGFTADLEEKLDLVEEGTQDWVKVVDKFYRPFAETLKVADEKIPKLNMEPEPAGMDCDKCGSAMVIKRGRYGKFIACSAYPECKNTKPLLKEIGVPCPNEGCDGQVVEKMSRKGKFYGCSNYPQCRFASWDLPINERCDRCGKIRVLKFSRGGKFFKACSDSKCKKETAPPKKDTAGKKKSK